MEFSKNFYKDLTFCNIYDTLVIAGKGKLVLADDFFEKASAGLRFAAGKIAAVGAVTRGRPECRNSKKLYIGTPDGVQREGFIRGKAVRPEASGSAGCPGYCYPDSLSGIFFENVKSARHL